jgi:lipopolysaccharide transport system ATP-binding protein
VIGSNGAGKSTLLKILSRITKPTIGRARLNGTVGSLLEVGTGFHPELTGRENVFLNGAILGIPRREIARKFDDIVDFAEVRQFLDTPVKRYSSGMYVRLAFAVAAHLEPEILLVDEVLAVGDGAFQRKCLRKMGDVAHQGHTIFFVSHNMGAITRLCNRGLWLEKGQVRAFGPVEDVVTQYLASSAVEGCEKIFDSSSEASPGSEYIRPLAVRVTNGDGSSRSAIDMRYSFNLELEYQVLKRAPDLRIGFTILAGDGTVILNTLDTDDPEVSRDPVPGRYRKRCTVPGNFLNTGHYFVSVGADFPMLRSHFLIQQVVSFRIEQTGGVGGHVADGRTGVVRMTLPWAVERLESRDRGKS